MGNIESGRMLQMPLVNLGTNTSVRIWDPRDVLGSINRHRVMSCISKIQDTQFPPPSLWASNGVEETNCIDSPLAGSIPMTSAFCNNGLPNFICFASSSSLWIKATAQSTLKSLVRSRTRTLSFLEVHGVLDTL